MYKLKIIIINAYKIYIISILLEYFVTINVKDMENGYFVK